MYMYCVMAMLKVSDSPNLVTSVPVKMIIVHDEVVVQYCSSENEVRMEEALGLTDAARRKSAHHQCYTTPNIYTFYRLSSSVNGFLSSSRFTEWLQCRNNRQR